MLLLQSAQLVKNPSAMQETLVHGKICWRKDRLPTPVFLGFPCGSADKESACNAGDLGSIPVLGRSPGEGKGFPLQYSGLENSMNYIVHGVAKSRTGLSDFHFPFSLQCLCMSPAGVNFVERRLIIGTFYKHGPSLWKPYFSLSSQSEVGRALRWMRKHDLALVLALTLGRNHNFCGLISSFVKWQRLTTWTLWFYSISGPRLMKSDQCFNRKYSGRKPLIEGCRMISIIHSAGISWKPSTDLYQVQAPDV